MTKGVSNTMGVDPLPSWLSHQPLVETVQLQLTTPHLGDNTADLDRLLRVLRQQGYQPLQVHPSRVGPFVEQIRRGCYEVTAVLGSTPYHWELLDVKSGIAPLVPLGFAIDLGSSRLAFYLLDLGQGRIIAQESVSNPQIPHGEDILTRINFARDQHGRQHLQRLLIECFNDNMVRMLAERGLAVTDVYAVTTAGNTTMSHFLLGLDASGLCREPYIPVANQFPWLHAEDLGLHSHPRALVYLFPNVGSYFGGDLLAGILASGMNRSGDINILVDVGTNAEVVVGNRDWLIACAGAAGPALEGGVVERGMMANPGAIDRVRIDPETLEPHFSVLGDKKPLGICGSGLIDLTAEMFMAGILTIQGKINSRLASPRIVTTPDGPAYVVAFATETDDSRDLLVSEIDIGILLKSKAAMYTILNVITRKVGVGFGDLKHFYVAGSFGNHIDPAMAVRIGMIPDLPLATYQGLGNTAGRGAAMVLLDRALIGEIERICRQITYVELNVNMELMNEFRGALFLPHTDPTLFPSVKIPERAYGRDN
jgi:uncharacterized 2Fe-2S/4Fe-4S cluster protein (DUF4445 family)